MSLPEGTSGSRTVDSEEQRRFFKHIHIEGECWISDLYGGKYGYTKFEVKGKKIASHRWSWMFFIGPLSVDQHLDHICCNPRCVNPAHLRILDDRSNILRGTGTGAQNARKTHCIHGHPFSPENTLIGPRGFRICRTCNRERARKLYSTKAVGYFNARKTHCAKGHPYSPENTHITPEGWRKCITCAKEQNTRDLERRRLKYHHDKRVHQ